MNRREFRVVYIFDGDTILASPLEDPFKRFVLRARWIDSPEVKRSKQSSTNPEVINHWWWGEKSKTFLIRSILNKIINVVEHGLDKYNRIISDWYLGEAIAENLIAISMANQGLVANSLPFQQYDFSDNDLEIYISILSACAQAKQNQLGFWTETNFLLPYKFKKTMKT